jgi:hypothetical protein
VSIYVVLVLILGFLAVITTAVAVAIVMRSPDRHEYGFYWRVYKKGGRDDLQLAADIVRAGREHRRRRPLVVVLNDLRWGHRGDGNVDQARVRSENDDNTLPSSGDALRSLPAETRSGRPCRNK